MKRKVVGLAILPALALAGVLCARPASSAAPYRISALRAQLFYSDRGTFSRDVLADTALALWNTPIGEGNGGGPSSSTLVVVEVSGAPESYEADRSVELTAMAESRLLLRRTLPISGLNDRGRGYAGFLVYDTGCTPVRLSARIVGQTPAATRTAIIPFDCGE
jgi:hypothetical protein